MPGGGDGEEALRKPTLGSAAGGTSYAHACAAALSCTWGRLSTGVGQLSAVTMQAVDHVVVLPWRASSEQVQLCEWRQFMDHLAKASRSIRITQVRGASRVRATGWCFCAD